MKGPSRFYPIPELLRPTADVTLVFLSTSDIAFVEPSNDSWYSAHFPLVLENAVRGLRPENISFYFRDDPVRVLGCASQYQYCNPNLKPDIRCTPLTGIFAVQAVAESLWQTERQKKLFNWSANAILNDAIGLPEVLSGLGVSSLTSRYKLANGVQGPLPENQWQLEVEHWFTATLADLQKMVVDIATGPMDTNVNQWLRRPQTPEEHLLCHSQVSSLLFLSGD